MRRRFPDAEVMLYLKRGRALAREMKWLGSHRYAVMNLGAADEEDLERRYAGIRSLLRLPDPLYFPAAGTRPSSGRDENSVISLKTPLTRSSGP